jgi:hypothetical protein
MGRVGDGQRGGWDAASPGMRVRLALLHFIAGFAAPAGATTVWPASAKCRCSTGCGGDSLRGSLFPRTLNIIRRFF